jgi:hypothetical protein
MNVLVMKSLVAFAVGAILMLALSFTVYRQSYYYKKAEAEMHGIQHKPGILSRIVTVVILLMMILFFVLTDLWISSPELHSFAFFLIYNLILAGSLSLFDTLFIDIFVLLVWRPAVLRLPKGQPTRKQMSHHVKNQLTWGWIVKFLIALLAAAVTIALGAGIS